MSRQEKLTYILPTNLHHPGIAHKVSGQVAAFKQHYRTKLITYSYTQQQSLGLKLFQLAIFHLRSFLAIIRSDRLYVRYNAKLVLLNFVLGIAASRKPIFLEYGSKFNHELKVVNRPIERLMHQLTLRFFSLTQLFHAGVTTDINNELIQFGIIPAKTRTIPNGFQYPTIHATNINQDQLQTVIDLKKTNIPLAIFAGNHYPWHGIDKLITLAQSNTDFHIILIGPKHKLTAFQLPKNITVIGEATPDTLYEILTHCDIGIGSLNLQKLHMFQGSPLKTPMYLCFGLPIIVGNEDMCGLIPELSDYVINIHTTPTPIADAIKQSVHKKRIAKLAQDKLAWRHMLSPVFNHTHG